VLHASYQEEHPRCERVQRLHREQGPGFCSARPGAEEEGQHILQQAPQGCRGVSPSTPLWCPAVVADVPDKWSQGHEQWAVEHVVLVGAQVLVGAARSHSWMQPRQQDLPGKGLADKEDDPAVSLDFS